MRLTIGSAVFDDFTGLFFTYQALRLFHNLDVEYLIVDNNPGSPQGQQTAGYVQANLRGRYIAMPEPKGTTQPRQRIFDEATGDAVLVLDPHVLLPPGTLIDLLRFYGRNPDTLDLYSGPMLYDNLESVATHFDPVWGDDQMWGRWGSDPRGHKPDGQPFEVWGQGLGLFTCRKAAWLGFNPHFRGFGGEEGYIHEKFRKAGRKCWCLPWLRWNHYFGRPNGVPYQLSVENKCRNYVLGHQELGLDLNPVHQAFVGSGKISQAAWDKLLADPTKEMTNGCKSCGGGGPQPAAQVDTLDGIFDWLKGQPRDLNEHMPKLRELAARCEHVTEFATRRESTVALLAGRPKLFRSFQVERDPIYDRLHAALVTENQAAEAAGQPIHAFSNTVGDSMSVSSIDETDLLFLDTEHNGDRLALELSRFAPSVRRYIVLHDTDIYGERGDNGQAGLLVAVRAFLKANPEWTVHYHTRKQYGLTVLTKDPADKPALPNIVKMAWNYSKAWLEHQAAGRPMASESLVQLRLDTCAMCSMRRENQCAQCGCFLDADPKGEPGKALWRIAECPLGFWAQSEAKGEPVIPLVASDG